MKIIRSRGNGSCLFISLRLALEYKKILETYEKTGTVFGLLDGHDHRVAESAEKLRDLIVKWYESYLTKELPTFGNLNEGTSKPWVRGDILVHEAHNVFDGLDVPEEGEGRIKVMRKYLQHVSTHRTWGGQAEYIAFAFISKLNIEVYDEKQCVDRVNVINSIGTAKLYFSNKCHYDLLIDDDDAEKLKKMGFRLESVS
jgi:hypothetical protein